MYYATPPRTPARLAGGFIASQAYRLRSGNRYARSYTKTDVKYRKPYQKSQTLKKALMATQPAKHCSYSDINVTGTHNTVYTFGPSQTIVRGTGSDQRIGDSIHMLALKVSGFAISNAAITKAVEFRIMTLWSGEEYSCATSLTTGLTMGEIMITSSTPGWAPNGLINPKAVTILDDRVITLNNSITSVSDLESFSFTVPLNTDFDYQASGSVYGKTRNLYVVVMAAIVDGVTGTTVWGLTNLSADLIFK